MHIDAALDQIERGLENADMRLCRKNSIIREGLSFRNQMTSMPKMTTDARLAGRAAETSGTSMENCVLGTFTRADWMFSSEIVAPRAGSAM